MEQQVPHKFSGAKIRQARHEMGWSQAELAFRAGVRERQVVRWENDQHEPRIDGISKIAAATGKDVGDFMADNGAASSDDDEEAALAMREAFDLFVDLMGQIDTARLKKNARKRAERLAVVSPTSPAISPGATERRAP